MMAEEAPSRDVDQAETKAELYTAMFERLEVDLTQPDAVPVILDYIDAFTTLEREQLLAIFDRGFRAGFQAADGIGCYRRGCADGRTDGVIQAINLVVDLLRLAATFLAEHPESHPEVIYEFVAEGLSRIPTVLGITAEMIAEHSAVATSPPRTDRPDGNGDTTVH